MALPTPMASAGGGNFKRGNPKLQTLEASALPTPTRCGDWNRHGSSPSGGDGLSVAAGPSIRLREWMMGLPRDWIAVDASGLERLREMASSSRARKRSALRSAKRSK